MELLGGQLDLQSERGIGSRFFFQISLPAVVQMESQLVPLMPKRLRPGCLVQALVVDDRPENRDVLGRMLAEVGCEVSFAASGSEAVRSVADKIPDLVFLDWLLPDMPGTGTVRAMLSGLAGGRLKIVAHTASALAQYRDEACQSGCVDFLTKPIRAERVYDCLRQHLGVEFDYAEPVRETETLSPWTVEPLYLPVELCARLATAAELHSTTVLKSCLMELRQLGPGAEQLAERIRHLMRSYDMDGILRLISRVTVPAAAPANVINHHGHENNHSP